MDLLRKNFDYFYDMIKPLIFFATRNDPEIAHELFVHSCQILHKTKLERIILDNETNKKTPDFTISNAAGLNKNAEIPPATLKYLGFDRVVIGTITGDSWHGNPRPRTVRYSKIESLVNWVGLSNDGVEKIAEKLSNYQNRHNIPLTASIAPTPNKKGEDILRDLEKTIIFLKDNINIDRFELNISCPNITNEYSKQLKNISHMIKNLSNQDLYLKVSPDINKEDINEILINSEYINGFVTTNTSTDSTLLHYKYTKGAISGNVLYDKSLEIQKLFYKEIKDKNLRLIACGGINSTDKIRERLYFGAKEIQIYTPLIFSGTKLLREFRG